MPVGIDMSLNRVWVMSVRLDHLLHMSMFIPWAGIIWLYLWRSEEGLLRRSLAWIAAGLLLAVLAETLQYWIPYRSFNLMDMFFNMLGVLIGAMLFFINPYRVLGIRRQWAGVGKE